jgi:hypothetical protein
MSGRCRTGSWTQNSGYSSAGDRSRFPGTHRWEPRGVVSLRDLPRGQRDPRVRHVQRHRDHRRTHTAPPLSADRRDSGQQRRTKRSHQARPRRSPRPHSLISENGGMGNTARQSRPSHTVGCDDVPVIRRAVRRIPEMTYNRPYHASSEKIYLMHMNQKV